MIDAQQIEQILSLYKRHGWQVRGVLLTETVENSLAHSVETLFGAVEVVRSEIDAVWFSRSAPGAGEKCEAWEIRHLSRTPYALIEVFDEDDEEEVREEARHEIEQQLKNKILKSAPGISAENLKTD